MPDDIVGRALYSALPTKSFFPRELKKRRELLENKRLKGSNLFWLPELEDSTTDVNSF